MISIELNRPTNLIASHVILVERSYDLKARCGQVCVLRNPCGQRLCAAAFLEGDCADYPPDHPIEIYFALTAGLRALCQSNKIYWLNRWPF